MKLSDERKAWLREQLADKSECQLFNFGENEGFDIHGDVIDLLEETAALKRDFTGVHQVSQDVISLAEEIRKTCPQGKIEKRWVLEARARGFSMRMLCERRKADALIADTQEQEDGFCPACDAGVGHCNGPHKGNDEIPF